MCAQDGEAWADCPTCGGKGVVAYDLPAAGYWANLANETASVVFGALGIDHDDLSGAIDLEAMPAIRRAAIRVLSGDLSAFEIPSYHAPGGHAGVEVERDGNVVRVQRMGAAVHHCGPSADRIRRQVLEIARLVAKAQEVGEPIFFG